MAGNSSTFKAFCVVYGGELFFLDRFIDQTRQSRRRVSLLDGDGLTDAELIHLCETNSEDPRTILLDNAQELKGDAELRRYAETRNARDQSVILVAVVRAEKLPEVWSLVGGRGKTLHWEKIKPWKHDAYLGFVSEEATRLRVAIRKEATELLFQCTGPDLYRLANEMRKLSVYCGEGGEITKNHVMQLATRTPHAEPAMVAEAVMAKDPKRALQLFALICAKSGETQFVPVITQLMKQVETALVVRTMFDKGMTAADAAALLGQNLWRFSDSTAPIARKHDAASLIRHMGQLSRLDADVKSSSPFKRTMIEMAMLSIAN